MNLRPYQQQAVESVLSNLQIKNEMLLHLATGTGKTIISMHIVKELVKNATGKILFLVDRDLLRTQTLDTYTKNMELFLTQDSAYCIGNNIESNDIVIETVQTFLNSRPRRYIGRFQYIIFDECHRGYREEDSTSDSNESDRAFSNVIRMYKGNTKLIGLTATPTDETRNLFGNPIYKYTYSQAIADGFLSKFKAPKIYTQSIDGRRLYDIEDVHNGRKIKNVYMESTNYIATSIKTLLDETNYEDNKSVLLFAKDRNHAQKIRNELIKQISENNSSDKVEYVDGETSNRHSIIERFKNGEIRFLVSVELITTGVDIPRIDTIVFFRNVKSKVLYEQMIGRATRLFPGKTGFTIFDFANTYNTMIALEDGGFTDMTSEQEPIQRNTELRPRVPEVQLPVEELDIEFDLEQVEYDSYKIFDLNIEKGVLNALRNVRKMYTHNISAMEEVQKFYSFQLEEGTEKGFKFENYICDFFKANGINVIREPLGHNDGGIDIVYTINNIVHCGQIKCYDKTTLTSGIINKIVESSLKYSEENDGVLARPCIIINTRDLPQPIVNYAIDKGVKIIEGIDFETVMFQVERAYRRRTLEAILFNGF